MKFDNSQQSAMYLDNTEQTPFSYVPRMALGLFLEPNPKRALLVGLGAGSVPKLFLAEYPELVFDAAEIDPAVVDVAREHFYLPDTPRLQVHAVDGRDYLERTLHDYNIIFLDAYYADSIPFHLTTQEFLMEVKDKLQPGGVVVANIIGSVTGENSRLFRAMYRTFWAVYPEVHVFTSVESDGSAVDASDWQNIILVAAPEAGRVNRSDFTQLPERVSDGVSWVRASELVNYADALYQQPIAVDDVPLLTDDYAPLDSLLDIYREQVIR
jgi:spermidine synthase